MHSFTLPALLLVGSLISLHAPQSLAQTAPPPAKAVESGEFKWERIKTIIKPRMRVNFSNGTALAGNGKDKEPNRKIIAHNKKTKRTEIIIENDSVYIAAAYPSANNAEVAVLGQSCTQEECRPQDLQLLVVEGDFVRAYSMDDAKSLSIAFQGNTFTAMAEGISMGLDGLGGEIEETLVFKPGLGFASKNLPDRYATLVRQHPEKLLSNPVLREPLLGSMGRERFKDFREGMKVSSGIQLKRGKFLFMQGCQAHQCADQISVLLMDGTTGDTWWAMVKPDYQEQTSGAVMNAEKRKERQAELAHLVSHIPLEHEDFTLGVNNEGLIQIESIER